jgi:hypothetical protein
LTTRTMGAAEEEWEELITYATAPAEYYREHIYFNNFRDEYPRRSFKST